MKEVLTRRYTRLMTEAPDDLPQLIVVDGGKGQLSAAVEALTEIGLHGKIAVVGIAKRLEEIYFPATPSPSISTRPQKRSRWCSTCATRLTASVSPTTATAEARAKW